MPDIAMCEGTGCPMRDNCYRYRATPDELRQSYFSNVPYDDESEDCDHYWAYKYDGCGHDQNEKYYDN